MLAAKLLAERVACELRQPLGRRVGYSTGRGKLLPGSDVGSVVFAAFQTLCGRLRHGAEGLIHVILDEAHERSCNVDVALLLVRESLRENSDCSLRVVIMSATPDVAKTA